MNQEIPSPLDVGTLINQINTRDLHLIVTFLDSQTIQTIMSCKWQQDGKRSRFIEVVRIRYFIHNYLTRMDRSIYMPFYSESNFIRVEHDLQRQMCHISSNVLSLLFNTYQHISSHMHSQLTHFEHAEDTIKSITDTLVDPQLPFPKLRKQTVGMHCNSAFQFFLVDRLLSPMDDDYLDQPYQQLKLFLEQKWNKLSDPSPDQAYLMTNVLSKWFKITYQNFEEYLIEENTNHNLIILVIALIDLIIDTFRFYIESIKDPLHSFVEFNMRYCIFRNSILRLEENLGFLFKGYTDYCYNKLQTEVECRQMTIWHIALSKWYLHLHRNHEEYFRMYFYLLRKVNFIAIKDQAQNRLEQHNAYIELKNLLELNDIDLLERQECFQLYSPIEQFFEADTTLYKQLIQEYIEYKIDISINEFSVHWCGHSHHELHIPYKNFQGLFLPEFKTYLLKVVQITRQMPKSIVAVDQIICSLLNQLDCDYLKPVTLKKVIDIVKEELELRLGKYFEQTKMCKKIKEIEYYFSVQDKKLEMFNNQNNIGNEATIKYSIIVQNEQFNKMLQDSSSTIATKRPSRMVGLNLELSHSMQEERNC